MTVIIDDATENWTDAQRKEAFQRAALLFETDGMSLAATFMAGCHPRAIDYLEQAPVLAIAVFAGGGRLQGGRANREYAQHKMRQVVARGGKLRDVLRAYHMPLQYRQIHAKALSMEHEGALMQMAQIPPSTLAQIIPKSMSAQKHWLGNVAAAVRRWKEMVYFRQVQIEWLASQAASPRLRRAEVVDLCDFLGRGDRPLNPAWSLMRAQQEMRDWHDRLSAGDSARRYGVIATQNIDRGEHPDLIIVDGFEFVALRTPMAIHAEGQHMRHCVASYVNDVLSGRCSIVSIQRDEKRIATMELVKGRPVQIKGRCNAAPGQDVRTAAQHYCERVHEMKKTRWQNTL